MSEQIENGTLHNDAADSDLQGLWDTPDGRAPHVDKLTGKTLFSLSFGEAIALEMAMQSRPENAWMKNLHGLKFDVQPLTMQTVRLRVYHETTGDSAEFVLTVKE